MATSLIVTDQNELRASADHQKKIWRPWCRWIALPITSPRAARAPWIRSGAKTPGKKPLPCLPSRRGPGRGRIFRLAVRLPYPQIKNPNSLTQGIEDCTRLAWSSRRRPARIARACPSILQAGFLALGSIYSRRLPRACINPSGLQPVSSPITAAGPRRFFTVFPLPLWDL